MEEVSFEIAKALKEAGYPQGITKKVYASRSRSTHHRTIFIKYVLYRNVDLIESDDYDIPTYFDVWTWLWRKKTISIEPHFNGNVEIIGYNLYKSLTIESNDPEDAIKAAIKYLVENGKLIEKFTDKF